MVIKVQKQKAVSLSSVSPSQLYRVELFHELLIEGYTVHTTFFTVICFKLFLEDNEYEFPCHYCHLVKKHLHFTRSLFHNIIFEFDASNLSILGSTVVAKIRLSLNQYYTKNIFEHILLLHFTDNS